MMKTHGGAEFANAPDRFNYAPLAYWAAAGNVRAIKMLLTDVHAEVQVDRADHFGCTALMLAAEKGHEEAGRLLIEMGANVNRADKFGETVLMHAIKSGSQSACKWLLELKADINMRDKSFGYTPLAHAASNGRVSIMKLLLDEHAAEPTRVAFEAAEDAANAEAYQVLKDALAKRQGIEEEELENKEDLALQEEIRRKEANAHALPKSSAQDAAIARTQALGQEAVQEIIGGDDREPPPAVTPVPAPPEQAD